jgi:hypothetical protein
VYDVTKKLCKDQLKNIGVVKNKDGTILSKESEIQEQWKEHFNEVLNWVNKPETTYPAVHFDNNQEVLDIEMGTPSKDEIRMALSLWKTWSVGSRAGSIYRYSIYSTVVADFVFSTQPPWAFLPCSPKIYLSYAGGQRGRPPIAVEIHHPRTCTRLYFTCALLSAICFIDVHVQFMKLLIYKMFYYL